MFPVNVFWLVKFKWVVNINVKFHKVIICENKVKIYICNIYFTKIIVTVSSKWWTVMLCRPYPARRWKPRLSVSKFNLNCVKVPLGFAYKNKSKSYCVMDALPSRHWSDNGYGTSAANRTLRFDDAEVVLGGFPVCHSLFSSGSLKYRKNNSLKSYIGLPMTLSRIYLDEI